MRTIIIAVSLIAISGAAHAGLDENWNFTVENRTDRIQSCRSLNRVEDVMRARGDKSNPLSTANIHIITQNQAKWCAAQPKAVRHNYGSRY